MALNPQKVYDSLVKAGDDWSDKDAAATLLEETKKTVLAKLKLEVEEKSDAARETVALCHPEYEAHLKAMTDARKAANKAKVRYDSAKTLAELRRSEEATRRAEASIL